MFVLIYIIFNFYRLILGYIVYVKESLNSDGQQFHHCQQRKHSTLTFVQNIFRQVGGFLRVLRFPPPKKMTVNPQFNQPINFLHKKDHNIFLQTGTKMWQG